MMIFRLGILTIITVSLVGCATAHTNDVAALALAKDYCAAVVANDEVKAEALMGDALRAAIANARAVSGAFEVAHSGDKPPLGDGLPLAAFPDVPSKCTPTDAKGQAVALKYELAYAPEAAWQDRLIVEGSGGNARVADVLFAPDFKSGLRQVLDEIAKNRN
jgi:hypothetical protein